MANSSTFSVDDANKHGLYVLQKIYESYNGTGFSASLVAFYSPTLVISLAGIVLNASLIYVNWKCRSTLCNSFNVLICVESLSAALLQYSYALPFLIALCGRNLVPARLCFLASWPGLFGGSVQSFIMFCISLERLHCILFPQWNGGSHRTKMYLVLVNVIAVLLGSLLLGVAYVGIVDQFSDSLVACYMQDYMADWAGIIIYSLQTLLQLATFVCYGIIWILMLRGALKRVQIVSERNLHVLKSISVIMAFIFVGWTVIELTPLYFMSLSLSAWARLGFFATFMCFNLFASSVNGPVLFLFSSEYRKCFEQVFPWLPKRKQAKTPVVQVVASTSLNLNADQVRHIQ